MGNNRGLSNPLLAAGTYAVLNFLPSMIAIILLPVYLKYLTPSDYGSMAMLGVFGGFYSIIACLQLNVAASVNYYDYNDDRKNREKYMSSIFTTSVLLSAFTFLIFLVLGSSLLDLFLKSQEVGFFPYGLIVLISGFLGQGHAVYFVFLKNEYRLKDFFSYSAALILTNAFFQYYLIVILEMGVLGSILGALVSKLLVSAFLFFSQRQLFESNISKTMVVQSLKFSIPFTPIVLINWFATMNDRFFMEKILSLEEVGKYALLANILLLAGTFFGALMNAFMPYLFENFKQLKHDNIKAIQLVVRTFLRLGILTLSGIILVGSNLHIIISNQEYTSIIPLFSLGALIMLPKMLLGIPYLQLMYMKKSRIIFWYTLLSVVIAVIGFVTLIPLFQLKGALYSLGISNTIFFILIYYSGQRTIKLPLQVGLNVGTILLSLTLGTISYLVCELYGYAIGIYGMLQFAAVVSFLGIISIKEIRSLVQLKFEK